MCVYEYIYNASTAILADDHDVNASQEEFKLKEKIKYEIFLKLVFSLYFLTQLKTII